MSSFAIFPEHIEFLANFSKNYIKKDGSIGLSGNLDLGSNKIINLITPVDSGDAATKAYVDQVVMGGSNNIELTGYLKIDSNTTFSEPSGDTLIKNSASNQNLLFEIDTGQVEFSVNGGTSNSLVLGSDGILTVQSNVLFSEVGILTKTSSDHACFMYNGGLTTDTDYAIKQTNVGATSINAKLTKSINKGVNGNGNPKRIAIAIMPTSPKLPEIKNAKNFFILS